VRRGVYVERGAFDALDVTDRHLISMHALDAVSAVRPVFSHWSAAVLLGLPLPPGALLSRPHVTVAAAGSRGATGVAAHVQRMLPSEVLERQGLLCTDAVRTVVDVAAFAPFAGGVIVADAALHEQPSLAPLLLAARDAARERRASSRIAAVVGFADGSSESPGESLSRVTMERLGLPRPVLQHVFRDRRGFAARVDFWFPDQRVAGEMDGRAKYLDPSMNGGDPAKALYEEKVREDRVRALGVRVVRWGWSEAGSVRLLGARLAEAGVVALRRR
jgi:hypothetical protein